MQVPRSDRVCTLASFLRLCPAGDLCPFLCLGGIFRPTLGFFGTMVSDLTWAPGLLSTQALESDTTG